MLGTGKMKRTSGCRRTVLTPMPVGLWLGGLLLGLVVLSACGRAPFRAEWPGDVERVWLGPEYWANPLQDWRLANGRLECVGSGWNRNVHLLTRRLGEGAGAFRMCVRLGRLGGGSPEAAGWAGFRVGARGRFNDYRDSAVRGKGLDAGITTSGDLFIGEAGNVGSDAGGASIVSAGDVEIRLLGEPSGDGYRLVLSVHDPRTGERLAGTTRDGVAAASLVGGLALVCSEDRAEKGQPAAKGDVRFWFADWTVAGSKVRTHDDRAFGPILFAQTR